MGMSGLESGRVILELTALSGTGLSLDQLLARMIDILYRRVSLPLRHQGILLLFNMRAALTRVAAHHVTAVDMPEGYWDSVEALKGATQPALIDLPTFDAANGTVNRIIALPMRDEEKDHGFMLLFLEPTAVPDSDDWEFMVLLASAVANRIGRFLLDEIVKVREWELSEARSDTIHRLGTAAEFRDDETGWHVLRVANYAVAIAKQAGMSEADRETLLLASPMHDVGKIGIPDAILFKSGRLSDEEMTVMRRHAEIGAKILSGGDPLSSAARAIAGDHHEKWDGSGYPRGLRGQAIPLMARITAIADVFDALTTKRTYKHAWSSEEARAWIGDQSGKHFDPALVVAFEAALPEILRIIQLYRDDLIDPRQVLLLPSRPRRDHPWFAWDDSLSVGIDVIDEHHRHLFDLVNDLHEVVAGSGGMREVARLIKELELYADVHFAAEEKMMAHFAYAHADAHKRMHQRFRQKIQSLREELHIDPATAPTELLKYVTDWLRHHISIEDVKLRALAQPLRA